MDQIVIKKLIAFILIFPFILFNLPNLLTAEVVGKGNLMGIIYGKDGTTPVEGAVIQLRNISTGAVYKAKTDKVGTFKIEGMDAGLYSAGIVTEEGSFNVESLIGIKANTTTTISLALKPYIKGEPKKAAVKEKAVEKLKLLPKIAKFFTSPIGLATLVAASGGVVYGIVKLTEKEGEVSPFK